MLPLPARVKGPELGRPGPRDRSASSGCVHQGQPRATKPRDHEPSDQHDRQQEPGKQPPAAGEQVPRGRESRHPPGPELRGGPEPSGWGAISWAASRWQRLTKKRCLSALFAGIRSCFSVCGGWAPHEGCFRVLGSRCGPIPASGPSPSR